MRDIAIRHWDGYWFGREQLWGDVFPHHWSMLTANVLLLLPPAAAAAVERDRGVPAQRHPLGIRDDPQQRDACARWAVRIGIRLRHGVSAEEIFELLASANRQLGVRVNTRQLAGAAMEIRWWYRREQDDPPRRSWPVIYTEPER